MNKLLSALIILTCVELTHGMELEREKRSSITLPQTYYQLSQLLNLDIACHIFFLQLGGIDLAILPFEIEQSCNDPEDLVHLIHVLIKSCGYNLAYELCKQFFSSERSICDNKNKNKIRPEYGQTALHNAAKSGNAEVVKFLLDIAGDNVWEFLIKKDIGSSYVSFFGHSGRTALHYAAFKGHVEVVKLLLQAAGNKVYLLLATKSIFCATALDEVVSNNDRPLSGIQVTKLLLDAAGDKAQDYIAMGNASAFKYAYPEIKEVMKSYLEDQCCLVCYPDCVLF